MAAPKMVDCPVCHGTPHIGHIIIYPKYSTPYKLYYAACNHCGAKTNKVPSRLLAVLQWNKMVKYHDYPGWKI